MTLCARCANPIPPPPLPRLAEFPRYRDLRTRFLALRDKAHGWIDFAEPEWAELAALIDELGKYGLGPKLVDGGGQEELAEAVKTLPSDEIEEL